MTLPPIPKDRNWSPETWRAGLDEAVRLCNWLITKKWADFAYGKSGHEPIYTAIVAHATTLLDAGIVKPVVSEAAVIWEAAYKAFNSAYVTDEIGMKNAIAVIQSALDKARSGQ